MSRSKKIVGLVLAVVLMLGSFTMAFAATDPGAGNYTATVAVTPAADSIGAGESTTVTVKATTNFTVGALSVPLFYEKANVTVSDIAIPATAGYAYSTDATASDAASIFASAGLDSATYGFVMVTYIPAAGAATKVFTDEQVLSFTVTAKAGVADGTAVNFKTVDASRKTSTNPTGTLYVGFINSDTINAVPTNIEATGLVTSATVTIGSAAAPELQLSATGVANGAVIDRVSTCATGNGFVYGINTDTGESIADYLTTPAGSIRVTENASGVMSTGATIELLAADGSTVLETYYFVFFGDVNGDGFVDGIDVSAVDGVASFMDFSFMADDGSVEAMASDVNGDLFIDGIDVSDIDGVASFMSFPTQADYAATLASAKGIS